MSFRTDRFFHPTSLMMLLACGALGATQQSCIDHAFAEAPPESIKTVKTVKKSKPVAINTTKKVKPGSATAGNRLMYTTYFYTANEAVIHGYENDTNVRIISMSRGGTIWKGKVKAGETKLIPTGKGAFSFVSDKKASILVGTPSRCAVVGYWVRDREGSFRVNRAFSQLPSMTHFNKEKVLVWAWEDTSVQITNTTTDKTLYKGKIKKGMFYEIPAATLKNMHNHVIDVRTTTGKKSVSVQVYYDEGFFVPGADGRLAGREMYTYVGDTTTGENDLQLFSYGSNAKVKVVDIKGEKVLFNGVVKADSVHTMTMKNTYVKITSDREISAAVAPYKHHKGAYQEHHFGAGQEGTGIENNFLITTPGELWVFSYFDKNPVQITNMTTGKVVYNGTLNKNKPLGLHPGHGFYRVKGSKGMSVMGGSGQCGAEFSPAGKLFQLDEELFKIVQNIKQQRINRAKAAGRTLSNAQLNAPLSSSERSSVKSEYKKRHKKRMESAPAKAAPAASEAEVDDRLDSMVTY